MALSKIAKLTLATGENIPAGGVLDAAGGFLYFPCYVSPGKVVKIRLSDFTSVATLTFATGENSSRCAAIDFVNGFLYVGCCVSPGKVVKIRLSDFTAVGTLTFPLNYNNPVSLIVDPANNYLYAYCSAPDKNVVRVYLDSFTVKDYINLAGVAIPSYETARADFAAGLVYNVVATPSGIAKVNLPAFSYVGVVAPASGVYAVGAAIDTLNGYYFVSSDGIPCKISRVILSSFLSDTFITLNAGENDVKALCANPAGKLLYAFTNTAPGRGVRVDIDTFTRIDALILPTGDNYPYCVVIDESTKNIYVGTNSSPGQVIKLFDGDIVPPGSQHLPVLGIG